ncbi:hypothetical protein RDV64_11275 [Acuticoccus sp. MNP-M23]|uniref:hypothetical protein n=1 Tax=Acuticoccus sp. MNP-M23 TaxID=3072793 RepID=UPI002816204A|nr:hypothetical protein [Acuticoccus sp. MNP-M23]WMS44926.1 hypothetical protein RDV64_11275 [Acuticoccus sp. MNP-M23]
MRANHDKTEGRVPETAPASRPFLTRNEPCGSPDGENAPTVVVLGAPRSGTSVTVGILQILGVDFGENVNTRGEDRDINRIIKRLGAGFRFWRLPSARGSLRRYVEEERTRWGLFGFKAPFIGPTMWALESALPNPAYVMVMRNPLSASISAERWTGKPWPASLWRTTALQTCYAWFAARTKHPLLAFSFEDHGGDGEAMLNQFAAFLNMPVTDEMKALARQFVLPNGGYRQTSRLLGWTDTVEPDGVRGWVADLMDPHAALSVEIHLGDRCLGRQSANIKRGDLVDAGRHETGICGFDIRFDTPVPPEKLPQLRILVPELDRHLRLHVEKNMPQSSKPARHSALGRLTKLRRS